MMFDDEIDLLFQAFNFQGGQYKKMGEKRLNKFCKSLYVEAYKSEYEKFKDASSAKVSFGTCPYPIVNNTVTHFLVSDSGLLPAYIPGREKWRIDIRFLKNNEVLGGYNVYALFKTQQSVLQGR